MLRNLCRAGVEGMSDMSGSNRREIYKEVIKVLFTTVKVLPTKKTFQMTLITVKH